MATMSGFHSKAAALVVVMGLCGCTVVEVHHADGSVEVQRELAVIGLDLPEASDGHGAQLVRTRVYGAGPSGDGFVLGYASQEIAYLDDTCRLVLFVSDREQMQAARLLVEDYPNVCLVESQ